MDKSGSRYGQKAGPCEHSKKYLDFIYRRDLNVPDVYKGNNINLKALISSGKV